ncbi:hypothetical protein [Pseudomonas syringae]|uniref:hypothetical protein n=1 Tax=Pseudomonas syringae TaxID=317 RepID=UPI000463FDA4|nr:hypothetical protein [Pseudomonas syringae]
MDKRKEWLEVLRALILILAPVGLFIFIASRYPSMIERRIEARASEQAVRVRPAPVESTLEIIMPDGKRMSEKEVRSFRSF